MAGKFYVVRNGRKKGIYRTWEECKAQVDGFPCAVYKSFKTEKEAGEYYAQDGSMKDIKTGKDNNAGKGSIVHSNGAVRAYVDGSYYNGSFSYGMVVLRDGKEICFSGKYNDNMLAQMHNVAGEIKGAQAAMKYALDEGLGSIEIYHDYEGIAKWCLGEWKANKEGTKTYKEFYDSVKDKVLIKFVKVKGHSHDKYNDMADRLAKEALGI